MIKLFIIRLKNRIRRRFNQPSRSIDEYSYGTTTKRAYHRRLTLTDDLKKQAALFFAFLAVGSVFGAIAASMLDYNSFGSLFGNVNAYIYGGLSLGTASTIIIEGLIKHGKIIVGIWLLGFVPRFAFLSLFLILAQGISLGFTTAILTRGFGIDGAIYAAALYLPQNILLLPAFFYVTTAALKPNKKQGSEYILRLVPAMAVAAVVSCFEWIITPALFGLVS